MSGSRPNKQIDPNIQRIVDAEVHERLRGFQDAFRKGAEELLKNLQASVEANRTQRYDQNANAKAQAKVAAAPASPQQGPQSNQGTTRTPTTPRRPGKSGG